jgi:hypothetical protein
MKAFLSAVVVAIVVAVGAAWILDASFQRPTYESYQAAGVRLDDPGHNLVEF